MQLELMLYNEYSNNLQKYTCVVQSTCSARCHVHFHTTAATHFAALPIAKDTEVVRGFLAMQAQAASERGSQADVVHAAEELQVCASVTRAVKRFVMSLRHRMQVNALPACSAFGLQCSWTDRPAL